MMRAATVLSIALAEDAPSGDLTTRSVGLSTEPVVATLASRSPGVFAGRSILAAIAEVAPTVSVHEALVDGQRVSPGSTLATLRGPAEDVLLLERSVLNLLSHLCGVATLTQQYVERIKHTNARVYDTRKTTPGLRLLEREAVRAGGGNNHRFGLSDAVLLKDNHLTMLDASPESLPVLLSRVRESAGPEGFVTLEVDTLDQLRAVVTLGLANNILLDNFSLSELSTAVSLRVPGVTLEASGGVTLDTIVAIAETGVDRISVGALTHSAPPLDLGLDFVPQS